MTQNDLQTEIEKNLEYFLNELPSIVPIYRGKFALLKNQQIVGYFDTVSDAVTAGNASYQDRIFSVQRVTDMATNLGFYSHAMRVANSQ